MPEGTHIEVTNNICTQVEEKIYDVIGRRQEPDFLSAFLRISWPR
jgi:hypothetical protein